MDPTASSVALGALISIIGALIGWYLKSIKADAAQAHEGIGQRIGGLDKRIDGLDKRIDGLDKRIDGLDKRIDGLQAEVADQGKALARIEGRLDPYVPAVPAATSEQD